MERNRTKLRLSANAQNMHAFQFSRRLPYVSKGREVQELLKYNYLDVCFKSWKSVNKSTPKLGSMA